MKSRDEIAQINKTYPTMRMLIRRARVSYFFEETKPNRHRKENIKGPVQINPPISFVFSYRDESIFKPVSYGEI